MHNRARGILQWGRTHKAIVPVCYKEQKKHLFDFMVLFWNILTVFADVFYFLSGY